MAPGSVGPAGVVHQESLCRESAPSLTRLRSSETLPLFYLQSIYLFIDKLSIYETVVFIYFGLKSLIRVENIDIRTDTIKDISSTSVFLRL